MLSHPASACLCLWAQEEHMNEMSQWLVKVVKQEVNEEVSDYMINP